MSADDTPPGGDPEHPISPLDRRWQAVGERRAHLVTADNPAIAHDYLVEHRGRLKLRFSEDGPPAEVLWRLRYVPDRLVLPRHALDTYMTHLAATPWPLPEAAAAALVADLGSEVMPRFLQLVLLLDATSGGLRVTFEERRPNWSNPALMARLALL
ncbi:hypothetical protein P7L74_13700 [Tistrella mobilis]|uniref:hypothetical protein n=1 Tax=Tistrella mobilis TaxID=171437 RepID=UPI0035571827